MTDRLDEIQARLDAATPGPWVAMNSGVIAIVTASEHQLITRGSLPPDADFIAHAPDDLAWLLERVARLEATVHNWEVWADHLDLTRWEGYA